MATTKTTIIVKETEITEMSTEKEAAIIRQRGMQTNE
jgi:hypothetical protein